MSLLTSSKFSQLEWQTPPKQHFQWEADRLLTKAVPACHYNDLLLLIAFIFNDYFPPHANPTWAANPEGGGEEAAD